MSAASDVVQSRSKACEVPRHWFSLSDLAAPCLPSPNSRRRMHQARKAATRGPARLARGHLRPARILWRHFTSALGGTQRLGASTAGRGCSFSLGFASPSLSSAQPRCPQPILFLNARQVSSLLYCETLRLVMSASNDESTALVVGEVRPPQRRGPRRPPTGVSTHASPSP